MVKGSAHRMDDIGQKYINSSTIDRVKVEKEPLNAIEEIPESNQSSATRPNLISYKSEYIPQQLTTNPAINKVASTLTERLKRIQQKNSAQLSKSQNDPTVQSSERWKLMESKINTDKYRPVEVNNSIYRKAMMLQEQMLNGGSKIADVEYTNNVVIDILNKKPVIQKKRKKKVPERIILN